MKIVLSLLNFRPERTAGIETYLRQLIPRLAEAASRHELVVLMDRDRAAENLFPDIDRAVVPLSARRVLVERGLEALTPYRCRKAEKVLDRLQPDVVLFPQQSIFPKNVAAPCVLVVHDLYHIFLPETLSPLQRLVHGRCYASSLRRADRIIAISQWTKKTIVEQYAIDSDRIAVIPHGFEGRERRAESEEQRAEESVRSSLSALRSPLSALRYVYYPATTLPRKNHAVLFESIAKLKAAGRFDYQLLLSGIQTPHWKTLSRQIRNLRLQETVRHLGYVPYDRVRSLYQRAECILFPSTFEGFGLPVLEAVEAGKKIIVSRIEVFRELGVPEKFQIDFSDPEQLDRALHAPGVTTLRHRPWTWQEAAAATMEVLTVTASRRAPDISIDPGMREAA